MMFAVTEEMHTWAVKPKQHCTRGRDRGGGGGANLFLLDTMIAWREIENCIEMPQRFCPGMSTFFVVVLKRAVFNGSTKSSFKIFLNFTYEEEFIVSLKCPYRQNFYFFFN